MWSLGLSLIELATGHFPIPALAPLIPLVPLRVGPEPVTLDSADAHRPAVPQMSIFDLMAHVIQDEPPAIPADVGFTPEFMDFVRLWFVIGAPPPPRARFFFFSLCRALISSFLLLFLVS